MTDIGTYIQRKMRTCCTITKLAIIIIVIASVSELCNCATRSHFALYVCMYLCQSRLAGAYQVMSYASAVRVSRGYMVVLARMSRGYIVCARARVAWLHGAIAAWRDFVSKDTHTTCRYLDRVKMNVAQYRVWPDPRASTL